MGSQLSYGARNFCRKHNNRAGTIGVLGVTGGTNLKKDLIEKMVNSGIDTLIAMYATKPQVEKAKEEHIHVVVPGHIPSDNIRINLLLDKMHDTFRTTVLELSGFKSVKRH